jgi:2-methylcitrate dehydratase PrpD
VLELTGKKAPATGLEGKFSVYHACAAAIVHGGAGEKEFSDEVVRDPVVSGLAARVSARADATIREEEARVRMTLRGGRVLEKHVEHAIGSLERPLSDAQLEAKFRALTEGRIPRDQADRVISICWSIGSLKDAGELARATGVRP